jgi:hypothetical protein
MCSHRLSPLQHLQNTPRQFYSGGHSLILHFSIRDRTYAAQARGVLFPKLS